VLSLFPVVVRPSSKIKASRNKSDDYCLSDKEKYDIYDENLALVNEHGYKQDCFTRFSSSDLDSFFQETMEFKGMPLIGIGPGARSYKDRYHYSTDYVVSNEESYEVVKRFMDQEFNDETTTDNGIILDEDEQKRRFVILNLSLYGIDASLYKEKFASSPFERFGPEFKVLRDNKCITVDEYENVKLTSLGYKFSPLLAQLFFSEKMKALELDL
jgi:oxygen-independent coproporphyrinogen-3 oxidase